ncbi:unnamed protein product [Staurois parvus]|uniref:Uncharacterized protein n=1 Tax=Staurois parvus TaxID=386267 RepID=A0ABN9F1T0_9NEOB|nr:unnamed protein product [Staurois parvus]
MLHFRGRDLYVNNTDFSPVSSCMLLCMALHSTAIQSIVLTVKHTHSPYSETARS